HRVRSRWQPLYRGQWHRSDLRPTPGRQHRDLLGGAAMTTESSLLGPPVPGMPETDLAPPQIARIGDPFATLRLVVFVARLRRNETLQLREVVASLNAAHLDWYFAEKV